MQISNFDKKKRTYKIGDATVKIEDVNGVRDEWVNLTRHKKLSDPIGKEKINFAIFVDEIPQLIFCLFDVLEEKKWNNKKWI